MVFLFEGSGCGVCWRKRTPAHRPPYFIDPPDFLGVFCLLVIYKDLILTNKLILVICFEGLGDNGNYNFKER